MFVCMLCEWRVVGVGVSKLKGLIMIDIIAQRKLNGRVMGRIKSSCPAGMIYKPPTWLSWALFSRYFHYKEIVNIAAWYVLQELLAMLHEHFLVSMLLLQTYKHTSEFTSSVKIGIFSVNIFSTWCRTHIDSVNNTHYSSMHFTAQSTICTKYIVYIISPAARECLLWAASLSYGTKSCQHPQQKPLFPRIAFQWFTSEWSETWWGRESKEGNSNIYVVG